MPETTELGHIHLNSVDELIISLTRPHRYPERTTHHATRPDPHHLATACDASGPATVPLCGRRCGADVRRCLHPAGFDQGAEEAMTIRKTLAALALPTASLLLLPAPTIATAAVGDPPCGFDVWHGEALRRIVDRSRSRACLYRLRQGA